MDLTSQKSPGSVVYAGKDGIGVVCGDQNVILITEVQAPGKKRMKSSDYLLGHPLEIK